MARKPKIDQADIDEHSYVIRDGKTVVFFTYQGEWFYQWERLNDTVYVKKSPDLKAKALHVLVLDKGKRQGRIRTHEVKKHIKSYMRNTLRM